MCTHLGMPPDGMEYASPLWWRQYGYQTLSGASGGSNEYAVEPVRLALHAIEGVQPMPAGSVRVVGLASPGSSLLRCSTRARPAG